MHFAGAAVHACARLRRLAGPVDFMGKLAGFQRSIVHLLIDVGWHEFCYSPCEFVAPITPDTGRHPLFNQEKTNGKDRRRRNADG
jgi:hypothetical protein